MEITKEYRIIKQLGKQSVRKFGEVYLVEHKESGKHAVLKAVRKGPKSAQQMERLKQESTFNFDFPGLPKVIHFEQTDQEALLLKDFEEGIPLIDYFGQIKRKEQLNFLGDFLDKFRPIFEHYTSIGIVHCDLKPSNILIHQNENGFDIKLIDFGLAIDSKNLEDRSILFPLGFAAPELLLNHLDLIDHRTDIYSLGIICWRLLADQLPLAHPNPSIFTNLQLTHPLPESAYISKSTYEVLRKMCNKKSFEIPPNRMETNEVRQGLIEGIGGRYESLDAAIKDLRLTKRKRLFF